MHQFPSPSVQEHTICNCLFFSCLFLRVKYGVEGGLLAWGEGQGVELSHLSIPLFYFLLRFALTAHTIEMQVGMLLVPCWRSATAFWGICLSG